MQLRTTSLEMPDAATQANPGTWIPKASAPMASASSQTEDGTWLPMTYEPPPPTWFPGQKSRWCDVDLDHQDMVCARAFVAPPRGSGAHRIRASGRTRAPPRQPGEARGMKCANCFVRGHHMKDCPSACRICGQPDHIHNNCPIEFWGRV